MTANHDTPTATFTLPATHALVRHNEDLQRVLTKRNTEIDLLKAIIEGTDEDTRIAQARARGYAEGWNDAIASVDQEVDSAIRGLQALGSVGRSLRVQVTI